MKSTNRLASSLRVTYIVLLISSLSFLTIVLTFSKEINQYFATSSKVFSESVIFSNLAAAGAIVAGNLMFSKEIADIDDLDDNEKHFAFRKAMFNQLLLTDIALFIFGILLVALHKGLFMAETLAIFGYQLTKFPTNKRLARFLKLPH
ncbi:MAG TPA: hypothetical protein VMW01_11675 [Williamwhitmania sp.]|nr:hypothetical protein [Williamwhitmania sp.]